MSMTNGTKVVSVHVYDYQQNDACVAVTMIAVLLTQATGFRQTKPEDSDLGLTFAQMIEPKIILFSFWTIVPGLKWSRYSQSH